MIYLDFDDTIFDTSAFLKEIIRIFKTSGIEEERFRVAYEKIRNELGYFELDAVFNFLAKDNSFDLRKTKKSIDGIFSNCDVFIFSDFWNFVEEFRKEELAIISFGSPSFQREKIENSKVVEYFSEIIITQIGKEKELEKKIDNNVKNFFVEDKGDQIDRVKTKNPELISFKMERSEARYSSSKSKMADYFVKDFDDVTKIIKSNI